MIQRCYIAGRISGIPRDVMEMYFAQAETEVEKMGYLPVGPTEQITNRTSLEFRIHRFTGCEVIQLR